MPRSQSFAAAKVVDTQLPPSLADFLKGKGFNAIHTTYFKKGHLLKDSEIINIAIKQKRIIITKDNDFFDHFFLKGAPPKGLLLELGNISNKDLMHLLNKNLRKIVNQFEKGANLIVIQKNDIITY